MPQFTALEKLFNRLLLFTIPIEGDAKESAVWVGVCSLPFSCSCWVVAGTESLDTNRKLWSRMSLLRANLVPLGSTRFRIIALFKMFFRPQTDMTEVEEDENYHNI